MTTNKGVNRTFLVTMAIYVVGSFGWGFLGNWISSSFYLDIFVSQMLIFLPSFFYIKRAGMKVGELVPYKRMKASDAILTVVMTYLFYPLLVVANLLTMFFVDNTSAEVASAMQGQNILLNILFVAFLPAFVEEFVFRGMLYQTYKRSCMWIGIVLSAFLFGCMHLNFNQFLYTFTFGMILAMAFETTGSMISPMICHFVLNLNSVLLTGLLDKIDGKDAVSMAEESASLAMDSQTLLLGTISWIVIAVFTTAGGIGLWLYLMRKNERIEKFREEMNRQEKEKYITVPLVIGIVLAIGIMILTEVVD